MGMAGGESNSRETTGEGKAPEGGNLKPSKTMCYLIIKGYSALFSISN
jgi:hypothetical protein